MRLSIPLSFIRCVVRENQPVDDEIQSRKCYILFK